MPALFYLRGSEGRVVENHKKAEQDYMAGMKYKEIAEKYGATINTVKSWKKRYAWDRKKCAPKNIKSVHTKTPVYDGTEETLHNDKLTAEQQLFCVYYIRTFNATQSYLNAYGCSRESANVAGPRLLKNEKIKGEIERLKEIKRQQIVADAEDIVELQMRIAFADIGNYVSFGKVGIFNSIDLKESSVTDTQLIKKVSERKNGITIEVEDRQKAIDWLTRYFLMHPDDRYKAEYDRKRAEVKDNTGEEILKNMQAIADILQNPVCNRDIAELEEV